MSIPALDLAAWESYYVIVGSSGAALIGLQFVVLTLIAGMKGRTEAATLSAFATPTVVHLTGALVTSAVMSAPWPSLGPAAPFMIAAAGLGLLVIGIHNAWDAVTHLVVNGRQLEKSRVHDKHPGHSRR